jgi:hypothetical protein
MWLETLNEESLRRDETPTRPPDYSFDAAAYRTGPPSDGLKERYALPHEAVLSTTGETGSELPEANGHAVPHYRDAMFIEFLVRRCDGSADQPSARR